MKAIIIGATGLVGSHLLEQLLNDPSIDQVISFVRRHQISHPKLEEKHFSTLEELPSVKGDLYFCCLGTTIKKAGTQAAFEKVDHDGVIAFAKIAERNEGKALVVISAAGANADSKIFYNRIKGQTEEDLKKLRLQSLTIMRPSLLIGERTEKRTAEEFAIKAYRLIGPLLPQKLKLKAGTEVNRLAVKMLEEAKLGNRGMKVIESQNII